MALNLIYTILWCLYFVATAPIHVAISAVVLIVMLPFDPLRRSQCRYSRIIERCLTASPWLRISVKGLENIDKRQTYLIVGNHQSMLDILFMYKVPLQFKWVSKREVYRIPLVGLLVWLHGDVTIRRGDTASTRRMLADCTYWLRRGMSMFIFPEGTRSQTGHIGDFKEGAFILAKKNGVPILPVVIDGTRAFSTSAGWRLLNARQRIQISILPPITAQHIESAKTKVLMEEVRNVMVQEYSRMRTSCDGMD